MSGHEILEARPGPVILVVSVLTKLLRAWRWWLLGIVCVVLLAVAVYEEAPMFSDSLHSFGHLRWRPLIFAVLFETLSMIALAVLERRSLLLAGYRIPVGRAVAIAYASNALAQSLPVVGSGAATGFTDRRLVAGGAAPTMAGWALILAGVASNAAFAVVICIGAIVSGSVFAIAAGIVGLVLTAAVVTVALFAMRRIVNVSRGRRPAPEGRRPGRHHTMGSPSPLVGGSRCSTPP
jgi:putative heme transporter